MPPLETKFRFFGLPAPKDAAHFSLFAVGHDIWRPPTRCSRPKGWRVDSLVYTIRGAARHDIGGKRSLATAGSLCIAPKDKPYLCEIDPQAGYYESRWIEFQGAWVRTLWSMLGLAETTHIPRCAEVVPIIEQIFTLLKARRNAALHEATALLWRLFVAAENSKMRTEGQADPAWEAVERARRFAEEHFAEPIGVADMAKAACWSPYHFSRVYRVKTGLTPAAHIRSLRVNHAQSLLQRGEFSIKQIGNATGYPSVQHFSTVFKKSTGMTPREFARSRELT